MKPGREIVHNVGKAVIAACLFGATLSSATEPPAVRSAIEERAADYRRLDPGVPVWPSTCDCISIRFGFKDASGYRPVQFRFADAVDYYGQRADATSKLSPSSMAAKGPLKVLVEDDQTVVPDTNF